MSTEDRNKINTTNQISDLSLSSKFGTYAKQRALNRPEPYGPWVGPVMGLKSLMGCLYTPPQIGVEEDEATIWQ